MNPKLIICVDGMGKDLVSKEDTPFIYSFGQKNRFYELQTIFGFTGIEYSFFTGKSPKKTRIWEEFVMSENSIFDSRLLRMFDFNKKLRTYVAAIIQYLKGRTWISGVHNIPRDKLKYFDSSVKEGLWKLNFFQDRDFVFYKWPFFIVKKRGIEKRKIVLKYESDEERLERLLNIKDAEIYYTQLMEIDKVVHKFGKIAGETTKVLNKIDKTIEQYVSRFLEINKDGEVFIWSDHGFSDIKNYINIEKILPKREDYLYFIAGTTASFWFDNENARNAVLNILVKLKLVKRLDRKFAAKFGIPYERKYGDEIFFVEKGSYFFPNFYQKEEKEKFKAMHGYPDDRELNGFFATNKKIKLDKTLKMDKVIGVLQ